MLLFKAQFTHALPCHGVIYSFQCNNILQALCSKLASCPKNSHSSLSRLLIFPPPHLFFSSFPTTNYRFKDAVADAEKIVKLKPDFARVSAVHL